MNKIKKTVKRVSAISLIFVLLFTMRFRPALDLFPLNDTYFEFTVTSDTGSWAEYESSQGQLDFRYHLKEGELVPDAKLLFHAHELARSIDISDYDILHIETAPQGSEDFKVTLYVYVPGYSKQTDISTHRPYAFKCRANLQNRIFNLPLKDFATPGEWLEENNITEEEPGHVNWSQVSNISISDFSGLPKDKPCHLSIVKAKFVTSPIQAVLPAGVTTLVGGIIMTFILSGFYNIKKLHIRKSISGNIAIAENRGSSDSLIGFLHENIGNPLLTLELLEEKTGISQYRANQIIREKYNIGYKQYLSQIRMKEAKALLRESTSTIASIGEMVGYLRPNSFARTFRNIEGLAPNEYRRQNKI